MSLSNEIITFAGGKDNAKFYEQFQDYHFHKSDVEWGRKLGDYDKSCSLSKKKEQITESYFAEIERNGGTMKCQNMTFHFIQTKR